VQLAQHAVEVALALGQLEQPAVRSPVAGVEIEQRMGDGDQLFVRSASTSWWKRAL